jgi:hypothetical protein
LTIMDHEVEGTISLEPFQKRWNTFERIIGMNKVKSIDQWFSTAAEGNAFMCGLRWVPNPKFISSHGRPDPAGGYIVSVQEMVTAKPKRKYYAIYSTLIDDIIGVTSDPDDVMGENAVSNVRFISIGKRAFNSFTNWDSIIKKKYLAKKKKEFGELA